MTVPVPVVVVVSVQTAQPAQETSVATGAADPEDTAPQYFIGDDSDDEKDSSDADPPNCPINEWGIPSARRTALMRVFPTQMVVQIWKELPIRPWWQDRDPHPPSMARTRPRSTRGAPAKTEGHDSDN